MECGTIIQFQTSTVTFKFGNEQVISPHTFKIMDVVTYKLIHVKAVIDDSREEICICLFQVFSACLRVRNISESTVLMCLDLILNVHMALLFLQRRSQNVPVAQTRSSTGLSWRCWIDRGTRNVSNVRTVELSLATNVSQKEIKFTAKKISSGEFSHSLIYSYLLFGVIM